MEVLDAGAVLAHRPLHRQLRHGVGDQLLAAAAKHHDPPGGVAITRPVVAMPDQDVLTHLPDVPALRMLRVHVVACLPGTQNVEADHLLVGFQVTRRRPQRPCLVDVHRRDGRFPRELVVVVHAGRDKEVPAGQDVPVDLPSLHRLELQRLPLRLRLRDNLTLLRPVEHGLPVHVRHVLQELASGRVEAITDRRRAGARNELLEQFLHGPVAVPFVVPTPGVRVVDLVRVRLRLHVVLAEQHLHQELVGHELADRSPDVLADRVDGLPLPALRQPGQHQLPLRSADVLKPLLTARKGLVHPPTRLLTATIRARVLDPLSPRLDVVPRPGAKPSGRGHFLVGGHGGVGSTHRLSPLEWICGPERQADCSARGEREAVA